jgi:CHAD domain-containing protein
VTRAVSSDAPAVTSRSGAVLVVDEPLPDSLRRITVELLDAVLCDIGSRHPSTSDERIHSARKKLKRVRALLRLVREPLGESRFRPHNITLRDVGRSLAPARDARVQVETLRALRQGHAEGLDESTFATTERWLSNRHAQLAGQLDHRMLASLTERLAESRSRLAEHCFGDRVTDGFESMRHGIARVYERGRGGCRRAATTATAADFHEWRKRVKYLRYQLEYLTPLQPDLIGSMADEFDRLGEDLGQEHDLDLLAQTLGTHPPACPDDDERSLLLTIVQDRRTALRDSASGLGTALYAEDVHSFVDRIETYWRAARSR